MQVPPIKIVRSRYLLTVENERKFSLFPEACIRGALGYLLFDWAKLYFDEGDFFKSELCIRLYEALVGPFPEKKIVVREATPPKMGMLFVAKDESGADLFLLELTLFGDNEDLLHLFTVALRRLGTEGVGRSGIRYSVHTKINTQIGILSDFISDTPLENDIIDVELQLYSPMTLKAYGGRILDAWDQDAFARNLYNRVELLCGALKIPFDFACSLSDFVDAFMSLDCRCMTKPVSRKRFSSRQKQSIVCAGFTGRVQIKSVPPLVVNLLLWGEQLAVGKNTTFGGGRYRLQRLVNL